MNWDNFSKFSFGEIYGQIYGWKFSFTVTWKFSFMATHKRSRKM